MPPINDTLKESKERRIFCVYQTGNFRVEEPNRFSLDALGLPLFLEGKMPTGIYDRTKSKSNTGEFKKGFEPWNKGKHPEYMQGKNHPMYGKHPNRGENNCNWKGGRAKHSLGYIWVKSSNHPFQDCRGYVLEHRLVVETQIGRHLLPKEKCHHLGARDDNRPHMLMAFISQSAHKRFEQGGKVESKEIVFDGRRKEVR